MEILPIIFLNVVFMGGGFAFGYYGFEEKIRKELMPCPICQFMHNKEKHPNL